MTEVEFALWQEANSGLIAVRQAAPSPCSDCTVAFYLAQHRAGTCDGFPQARVQRSEANRGWRERSRRARRLLWGAVA